MWYSVLASTVQMAISAMPAATAMLMGSKAVAVTPGHEDNGLLRSRHEGWSERQREEGECQAHTENRTNLKYHDVHLQESRPLP